MAEYYLIDWGGGRGYVQVAVRVVSDHKKTVRELGQSSRESLQKKGAGGERERESVPAELRAWAQARR
jgi:hypothetical protein